MTQTIAQPTTLKSSGDPEMKLAKTILSISIFASLSFSASAATPSNVCAGCVASSPMQLAQLNPQPGQPRRTIPTQQGSAVVTHGDVGNQSGCCPPVWSGPLRPMFYDSTTTTNNVTQRYGIRFEPTVAFSNQMQAYSTFVGLNVPVGQAPNSLHLDAELVMLNPSNGTGGGMFGQYPASWQTSGPPCAAATDSQYTPTSVRPARPSHSLMAWWSGFNNLNQPVTGIWNNSTPLTVPFTAPTSWNMQFSNLSTDPNLNTPTHLQPGKWYIMKLKFKLAAKLINDPNSWIVSDVPGCRGRCVAFFRHSSESFKTAPGAPASPMLTFDSQ